LTNDTLGATGGENMPGTNRRNVVTATIAVLAAFQIGPASAQSVTPPVPITQVQMSKLRSLMPEYGVDAQILPDLAELLGVPTREIRKLHTHQGNTRQSFLALKNHGGFIVRNEFGDDNHESTFTDYFNADFKLLKAINQNIGSAHEVISDQQEAERLLYEELAFWAGVADKTN
jgi:hypothetical protein